MGKNMASRKRQAPANWDISREIIAVLLLALGLFLSLSLYSFNPNDPGLHAAADTTKINNWAGLIGAYTGDIFITTFGLISFIAPPFVLLLAGLHFAQKSLNLKWRSSIGGLILLISGSAIIHLRWPTVEIGSKTLPGGGLVGGVAGEILVHYLNKPGAYLLGFTILMISFSLASGLAPLALFGKIGKLIGKGAKLLAEKFPLLMAFIWRQIKAGCTWFVELVKDLYAKRAERIEEEKFEDISPLPKPKLKPKVSAPPKIIQPQAPIKPATQDEQLAFAPISKGSFTPPPISLLDNPPEKSSTPSDDVLQKNSMIVEKKLADFGVEGSVTAIHPGPVITMYEFEPVAGTKVSKIANLEDDLSLTLGGKNVRIIPHLPGKAAVGIEVPNGKRDMVGLKEVVTSKAFQKTSAKLPLPLGVSADGHPMVTDLAKMPHFLIAGATGSGKSVAINCLITGLLYKLSPEQLKLIMIDPKMLELSTYQGIPHLLLPVVTKPKLAVKALKWAVREMERRYKLLSNAGARNLPAYNQAVDSGKITLKSEEEAKQLTEENPELIIHTGKLPYLVIIVDELADLMMTASQDMEDLIIRLAQMARAAGIHMILATQRPSVDVVTGLIKANFPARIAFKVTSRHDSRTILDSNGAEALLGSGDMLYMPPSGSNLLRVHGAYVGEPEVTRVVTHLQEQGAPTYDKTILAATDERNNESIFEESDEDNELYDQAITIVAQTKQASISMIQRRLRIGYNRAARLVEKMESKGVVGPAEGSKPREVLINNL